MPKIFFLVLLFTFCLGSCQQKDDEPAFKISACFSILPAIPTDVDMVFDASCSNNYGNGFSWFLDSSKIPISNKEWDTISSSVVGDHSLLLVITNPHLKDSVRHKFHIEPTKPKACLGSISPYYHEIYFPVDTPVTFNADCSTHFDPSANDWLITDGSKTISAHGSSVQHVWTLPGKNSIRVIVKNPSHTMSDTASLSINIH